MASTKLEALTSSLSSPSERRWFKACRDWVRHPEHPDPSIRVAPVLDAQSDRFKRIAALHLACATRLRDASRADAPSDCPLDAKTVSEFASAYRVAPGLVADLARELGAPPVNGQPSGSAQGGRSHDGAWRPGTNRVTAVALFVGKTGSSGDLVGVAADFILDLVPGGSGDCHPVPSLAFVEIAPDFQRSIHAALETLPNGLLRDGNLDIRWNLVRRDGGSLPPRLEGQSAGAAFALGIQKLTNIGDCSKLDLTRTAVTAALGENQTLTRVEHFQDKLLPAMKRSSPRICTVVAAEDQDVSPLGFSGGEKERNSRLLHDPVENLDILRAYSLSDAITRLIVNDEARWLIDCSVPDPAGFVGRLNLSAALDEFLSVPGPGYGVIAGGMGTGKTSFFAHYIRSGWDDPDTISHFIGAPPSRTTEPIQIITCLYDQLRRKHGIREPATWAGWTTAAKFEQCLRIVSRSLLPGQAPEVMFIDGADQAVVSELDPLLPGVLPAQLPPGIRIIITSRPNLRWLKDWTSIKRFSIGNDPTLNREVGGIFTDDRADVRTYLTKYASEELSSAFIEEIVQGQSAPLFFTVVTRLNQLKNPSIDPQTRKRLKTDASQWLVAPETLIDTEAERIESRAAASHIPTGILWETLGLLALAHEPLSPQTMRDLDLFDGATTDRILQITANFFQPSFQPMLPSFEMRFAHPGYYQEVLKRLDTEAVRRCRAKLAKACCRWKALSGVGRQYAMRHLSRHAADAGMWLRVGYSLRNLDLIEEKIRLGDGTNTTIFGVLNEYARALDGPNALPERHPIRPQIEAIARVLDRFAQTLVEAPHLLIQQLANELLDEWDGTTLGKRLKRAVQQSKGPWLRLKNRPLFPSDPALRRTLTRHRNHVYSVAFSPRNKFVASGSGDREAIVWDAGTGELVCRLHHDSPVTSVRFVGGPGILATGCLDGTLCVWNTHTHTLVHSIEFPRFAGILSMDVHPHKQIIATGCADGTIRLVSARTGARLNALWDLARNHQPPTDADPETEGTGVLTVAFSPCGNHLASGGMDRHVRVWNLATDTIQWKSELQASWIETLAFSPSSSSPSILAAGLGWPENGSGVIQLWDAVSGGYQRALYGHRSGIWALAFTPTGDQLVSGSCDRTVIVRNPITDARIACFRDQGDSVLAVACSPNSRFISVASADRKIRIYAAPDPFQAGHSPAGPEQKSESRTIAGEPHQALIHMDRISPDGTLHSSASEDQSARVWDVQTGRLVAVLKHEESVTTATFAHRKRLIATAAGHRTCLWNLDQPNNPTAIIEGHRGRILGMAFSHDDRWIATAGEDHRIMIWDADTGTWNETLSHHTGRVRCVLFSKDGRYLISGAEDRTVVVHDRQTNRTTAVKKLHASRIKSVAILLEKRIVASGGGSLIRLWELDSGESIRILKGHTDEIWTLRFSPDGHWLASGSRDGTARVWEVHSGECVGCFPCPNNVLAVQFHGTDGQELLVTDAGGAMHVPNVYHLEFANRSMTPTGRSIAP